jgi:alkanesulfonate monooxygenase SsuD/methylene tetrahydromethanopterin reductase-like flavin-dependent oxidoreductase (luciferase family)
MKHALLVPPVDHLADPFALVEVAVAAEGSGWDGVFVWDHVLRPAHEHRSIADPWVALAAIAVATTSVRLGTMVTPLTRRRPIKLAREAVTLDQLSRGRLTLGLGLGVDTSRELSGLGEVVDARARGDRLDEGVELLCRMWSGRPVHFHGEHFTADDVTVLPTPVQQPRIPLWVAARGAARGPVARAGRFDGVVPIDVDAAGLADMVGVVRASRGSLDGFDIVAKPRVEGEYTAFAEVGATWAVLEPDAGDPDILAIASTPPVEAFS